MEELSEFENGFRNFDPLNAELRLIRFDDDLETAVYIINADYDYDVEAKATYISRTVSKVTYYTNTMPATLFIVKKFGTEFKGRLCDHHTITSKSPIGTPFPDKWKILEDQERYKKSYECHRIRYLNKEDSIEPILKLKKLKHSLAIAAQHQETGAGQKLRALDTFLRALDNGESDTILDTLFNENNSLFKELIKPRPHIIAFLTFLPRLFWDHTAKSEKHTKTYQILRDLKNDPAIVRLREKSKHSPSGDHNTTVAVNCCIS